MPAKIKFLIEICIITLTAYLLADAAFVLLRPGPEAGRKSQPILVSPAPPPVKREVLSAFSDIGRRNLFHAALKPPAPKPKAPPAPKQAAITELPVSANLKLVGTVYSAESGLRRAVIQNGKKQGIYRQGQKVDGATIKDIQRRAVVIKRAAREEVVVIDANDAKVAHLASSMRPLSRKELTGYLNNLSLMANDIRIKPVTRGKEKGLAVITLRTDSPMHKAGLRGRDILLSANGLRLTAPADLMGLKKMIKENRVTLELLRDKKPFTLNLEIVN